MAKTKYVDPELAKSIMDMMLNVPKADSASAPKPGALDWLGIIGKSLFPGMLGGILQIPAAVSDTPFVQHQRNQMNRYRSLMLEKTALDNAYLRARIAAALAGPGEDDADSILPISGPYSPQ